MAQNASLDNLSLEKRYTKDPNIVSRQIAGEYILVPISQSADEVESIYTLNEVAARIWELLDGELCLNEIRDMIVTEFEVTPDEATADLLEFLQQLESLSAVKQV